MNRARFCSPSYAFPVVLTLVSLGWLAACSSSSFSLTPDPTPYYRNTSSEYYLYLPSGYTPDREWPLFVGIHGSGQDGTECLRMWQAYAEAEGFVLVCPSLADENGGWYVAPGEAALHDVLQQVRQECRVQKKFFLAGFSAGAAFALAYTYDNPKSITAAAILSSGIYVDPWRAVQDIPFLIVIGDQDSAAGVQGAQELADVLQRDGYSVELDILPGIKHEIAVQALDLTIAFYRRVYSAQP